MSLAIEKLIFIAIYLMTSKNMNLKADTDLYQTTKLPSFVINIFQDAICLDF